jgi:beta-mannosidase
VIDAPDRARIDLGGTWRAEPLVHTELRLDGTLTEDDTDLPPAREVSVPSNWYDTGLAGLHGRVAYERDLPEVDGDGWWLCFEGADYFTTVIVDGQVVLRHEGAFDPFDVPLPPGAERLQLIVDAPREEAGGLFPYRKRQLKGILTQWDPLEPFEETTGGCWGRVWLEQRPDEHVATVRTTCFLVPRPELEEGAYVSADATDARVLIEVDAVAAVATQTTLSTELCGMTARRDVQLPPGRSRHRLVLTVPDPVLWWPWDRGEPALHRLTVTLGDDAVGRDVGLREVTFDETTGTFTCNRETVAVRGSNVIPEKWFARYTAERAAADVALVTGAGLNAVRVAAHVAPDAFYDACDRAGVLVWQDLPLQWDYLIDDDLIREAGDQLERIVTRLHDHPCIALWSAHNEPFPTQRVNFGGVITRAIAAADGTRTLHAASDFSEHAYPGWFSGELADYHQPPAAPYVTEFGALALPSVAECEELGAHGWPPKGPEWSRTLPEQSPLFDVAGVPLGDSLADLVDASQRYQARTAQLAIESYRCRGITFFHFALLDGWPCVSWSVVSYARVKKQAYAALARAAQPLLIGADLTRRRISDAWDSHRFPVLAGIWVVNDTRENLAGCRWHAELGGHRIADGTIDVPADDIVRWTDFGRHWPSWSPPDLPAGEHELALRLLDANGDVRSQNAYSITMTRRDLDVPAPE